MQCPSCSSTDIEWHEAGGDAVCVSCGTVCEESTIVSSIEFSEAGGSASVVGKRRAEQTLLLRTPGQRAYRLTNEGTILWVQGFRESAAYWPRSAMASLAVFDKVTERLRKSQQAPCTRALAHASSLDTDRTRNTRAPTSTRSIGFCAI